MAVRETERGPLGPHPVTVDGHGRMNMVRLLITFMVSFLCAFGLICQEPVQSRPIRNVDGSFVGRHQLAKGSDEHGEGGDLFTSRDQLTKVSTDYTNNRWYRAMVASVRSLGVTNSCYVCLALPQVAGSSVPLTPYPLTGAETLGVLLAFTVGIKKAQLDAGGN